MRGSHHDRDRPPAGHHRARRPRRAPRRGRVVADGTHDDLLRTSDDYREVLAAARTPGRGRGGCLMAMWMAGGVDARRTGSTPRRPGSSCAGVRTMLRPYRRDHRGRPRHGRAVDRHDPRRAVPRPLRHRPGHQARDDAGSARRRRHRLRRSSRSSRYVTYRFQVMLIIADRRGVPPGPARPGLRPPAAPVDAVLRPREGRGDRLPHDERRRLAAGARADGPAHVRDQRAAAGRVGHRARASCRGSSSCSASSPCRR